MTIKEMQRSFQLDASLLGDYQSMSKTELANGYCDAEEAAKEAHMKGDARMEGHYEALRSSYHSALMLRYWYKIWEWLQDSKSLRLDDTEFVNWLADSLRIAFVYKTWRYEYKAKVSLKDNGEFLGWELDENGDKIPNPYYWKVDPNAPDKIINRCCFSTRGREYQYYNKDKRKAGVHTYSLDSMITEEGDYAINSTGCIAEDKDVYDTPTYYLVNALVSRNELLESLIIDGMASPEAFKEVSTTHTESVWDDEEEDYVERTIERTHEEFDSRKLVKYLSHLGRHHIQSFCKTYDVPQAAGDLIYEKLKEASNKKLYKLIKKVQIEVQDTPELRSLLS